MLGSSEVGATPPTPGKAKKPGSVGCRGVGGVAPTYVSLRPPRNTERRRSGLRPRRILIFPRQHAGQPGVILEHVVVERRRCMHNHKTHPHPEPHFVLLLALFGLASV